MELGAIGELVGGVAVIATLVYLALQVRQNTRQGAATFTYMLSSEFQRMHETTLSNPSVAELLVKLRGEGELTAVEEMQAEAYANRFINQWLSAEVAFSLGIIEREYFALMRADVERALSERPGLRKSFDEILVHYPAVRQLQIFEPFSQKAES